MLSALTKANKIKWIIQLYNNSSNKQESWSKITVEQFSRYITTYQLPVSDLYLSSSFRSFFLDCSARRHSRCTADFPPAPPFCHALGKPGNPAWDIIHQKPRPNLQHKAWSSRTFLSHLSCNWENPKTPGKQDSGHFYFSLSNVLGLVVIFW